MNVSFSHLHTHSEYSLLDGMSKVHELFDKAKTLGQPALAITDHGSTSALWEAQKYGESIGVKPILGTEFYYQRENDDKNGHLIVLAKNNIGLKNIFKLQEFGYVDNFYRRPRITFEKLIEYKEGLVVLSACLASTFSQYIMNGDVNSAKEWASKFQFEFGEDFYLEIQPNNILEQHEVNKKAIEIANRLNIKTVATNDVHYTNEEDAYIHEVLLAMQVGKKMSDEKRFKFTTQDFWMKSNKEMIDTFIGVSTSDIIKAMNNTQEIVDKCNARIVVSKHLPKYYNIPDGETARTLMVKELTKGARAKGKIIDKKYMEDIQKELQVIDEEGYCDYFLIVQDYIRSARERGETVGDGRGSASGAKTSYVMDITRIDPGKYDLLFERFMANGRSPDID